MAATLSNRVDAAGLRIRPLDPATQSSNRSLTKALSFDAVDRNDRK